MVSTAGRTLQCSTAVETPTAPGLGAKWPAVYVRITVSVCSVSLVVVFVVQ